MPGFVPNEEDRAFEQALIAWLTFHRGMLIGDIPYVYRYLTDNPAAPERSLYDYILVDEYQDLNKAEQRVIDLLTGDGDVCVWSVTTINLFTVLSLRIQPEFANSQRATTERLIMPF